MSDLADEVKALINEDPGLKEVVRKVAFQRSEDINAGLIENWLWAENATMDYFERKTNSIIGVKNMLSEEEDTYIANCIYEILSDNPKVLMRRKDGIYQSMPQFFGVGSEEFGPIPGSGRANLEDLEPVGALYYQQQDWIRGDGGDLEGVGGVVGNAHMVAKKLAKEKGARFAQFLLLDELDRSKPDHHNPEKRLDYEQGYILFFNYKKFLNNKKKTI